MGVVEFLRVGEEWWWSDVEPGFAVAGDRDPPLGGTSEGDYMPAVARR